MCETLIVTLKQVPHIIEVSLKMAK